MNTGRCRRRTITRSIVGEEVALFRQAQAGRRAVPAVVALRRHFETVRAQVLRQADADAVRATELLVNRLLHDPTEMLRQIASGEAPGLGDSETVSRVVAALFRLDDPRDEEKKR